MVAFARDPLDRAADWLEANDFRVRPNMGLEELGLLIDLAAACAEVTGAGNTRESIAAVLTAEFESG